MFVKLNKIQAMKKQLLSLIAGISVLAAGAQNFQIISNATGQVINGQTLTYWVPVTDAQSNSYTETHDFEVVNAAGATVTAKVRKVNLQMHDAAGTTWFCTDQNCYAPTTVLSANVNMPSQGQFALLTDFNTAAVAGTGVTRVRYTIFNTQNPNDSAYFEIVYNLAVGVGMKDLNVKASVSNPMPNPASSSFTMNVKMGSTPMNDSKLVIYNMLGSVVKEVPVLETEGSVTVDVALLDAGVYFCSLESNGKQLATKRLVVSH
ncbi:MAG: hypothetical protein Fur0041_07350 [Bacteroidia bacterium]